VVTTEHCRSAVATLATVSFNTCIWHLWSIKEETADCVMEVDVKVSTSLPDQGTDVIVNKNAWCQHRCWIKHFLWIWCRFSNSKPYNKSGANYGMICIEDASPAQMVDCQVCLGSCKKNNDIKVQEQGEMVNVYLWERKVQGAESTKFTCYTGWPKKVCHYQMIKKFKY